MSALAWRRTINIGMTMLAAGLLLVAYFLAKGTLRPSGFTSGWILLAAIVILAMYNIRKALPFLPLGSSAIWLQLHIYLGLLTFLVFAIHVDFAVPNGVFEVLLAGLYLTVFLSGGIGLLMTRTYPRRLRNLGDEVIFEHIPVARRHLQDQAEALVLNAEIDRGSSALPMFYRDSIRPFLLGRPDVVSHLIRGSSRTFPRLIQSVKDQRRYLNDNERETLAVLEALLCRKHQLDTQYSLQGALKVWLFVHIPATWSLLIFAVFHSMLVHAWSGGVT